MILPVNGVLDQGIIETLGVSEAAVIFEERLAGIIRRAYANSRQPAARADVANPEFYSKRGPQCPTCGNFRDMPHTCTDSFHAAREPMTAKYFWESMYGTHDAHSSTYSETIEFAEAYLANYREGERKC